MNRLVAALICGFSAQPLYAQNEVTSEIIVTASRTASVPVLQIEAARLTRLQSLTVLDVLRDLPAVVAFSKNGVGSGSYLSIEGGEPNYALVLIDGVRVTDPSNAQGGAFDFAQISPMLISHIDVASGAQSAVQGPDALAGVVHVHLRDVTPDSRNIMANLMADSKDMWSGDMALDWGWRTGGVLLGASAMTSGDLSQGSHLERQDYLARVQQQMGDISLRALFLRADSRCHGWPEDSGGPRLAPDQQEETRDTQFTLASLQAEGGRQNLFWPRLTLSHMQQDNDQDTPAIAAGVYDAVPAIRTDTRFTRLEATAEFFWQVQEALRLVLGGATLEEKGRGVGDIDFGFLIPVSYAVRRSTNSLFGEIYFAPNAHWKMQAGLRWDDPSTAPSIWHGSAYAQFTPVINGPHVHLRWSQGFKQPSIYALAYPLIANPALRPERGESYEAGVSLGEGATRLSLSYFHHLFSDMIDFDPEAFTNVNRARVRVEGVKALASLRLAPQWQMEGAASWMDVAAAVPLRSRPRWMGQARLLWTGEKGWGADLGVRHMGAHGDSSVATGLIWRPAYWTADMGLMWVPNPHLRFDFRVMNLTNADYEEAVGFPAPRRHVRLGLRFQM